MIAKSNTYPHFIHTFIHSLIPVKYIFLEIKKYYFPTPSQTLEIYMTSKYFSPSPSFFCSVYLVTPYFKPKKKATTTN